MCGFVEELHVISRRAGNAQRLGIVLVISDEDIMVERVGVIENGGVEFRDVMGPDDGVVVARVAISEPNDERSPQNKKES